MVLSLSSLGQAVKGCVPRWQASSLRVLSHEELLSRLRAHGTEELHRVRTAWLEPDGKVTFLLRGPEEGRAADASHPL